MPERVDAQTRRLVAQRSGFRCEYCLTPAGLSPAPYSAEHILPRSKGGFGTLENLAFSCQGCNGHKSAKIEDIDPVTRRAAALFHPRNQIWGEHFHWTNDGINVEGRTATGRATVASLHLNRPGLRNLRRLLILAGIHPAEV